MREEDAGDDRPDPVPAATATEIQIPVATMPTRKGETEQTRSLMREMAAFFGMEPGPFQATLMHTVMPKNSGMESVAALLIVAREYKLNPFLREVMAFESKGGIRPMVPIDGWTRIVNGQASYDGCELIEIFEGDKFVAVECKMYRKDRSHPVQIREYLDECLRDTDPWKKWPKRMLRHKAFIQAARLAFSLSGIEDPDEAERTASVIQPREGRHRVETGRIDLAQARAGVAVDPPGGRTLTLTPEIEKEIVSDGPTK